MCKMNSNYIQYDHSGVPRMVFLCMISDRYDNVLLKDVYELRGSVEETVHISYGINQPRYLGR